MDKKVVLIGENTPEQIADLKKKYGTVIKIVVENHVLYLREADWDDLNIASAVTDADHPMEYNRTLMKETFIGGSKEILDNPKWYLKAAALYNKRSDKLSASLEEL